MQPDTGIHHHALHLVLAHQDAALGIVGIVAGMDADALEIGHALKIRQPLLETGRQGDEHPIGTFGNGGMPRNLSRHLTALTAVLGIHLLRLQVYPLQVAPRRFQGIAEVSVLRQLLHVETISEAALVAGIPARQRLALHITISQQIQSADGISILLSYSLNNYLHTQEIFIIQHLFSHRLV